MKTLRQVDIKNRQNYFFSSMTNIKNFDPNLFSVDQISFKSADSVIYDIEYIPMKNLDNENSLYLVFNKLNAIPLKKVMKINTWILLLQTKIKKH